MKKYLLLLLVLTAFFLRIYKGPELFFWNVDEDIVGLTVKRMLVDHRPQLIGFPVPGGIYLGPLFYYLVSLPYFISRFNPEIFYLFSAILGTIATFLVYKIGATIFEKTSIGIIASLVFAVSYFSNVYSKVLTGLSLVPILALLTYLFLYKNLKLKKPKNLLLLGIVLLIAIQNEGSSFSLLALAVATWVIYRFKIPLITLVQIAAIFVIFHIPLLIFDLRHNFYISKSFVSFFDSKGLPSRDFFSFNSFLNVIEIFPNTLSRILYPSGSFQTSAQILPCPDLISSRLNSIPPLIFLTAVLILAFFLFSVIFKKEKTYGEKIIEVHFGIVAAGIFLFNLFLRAYLFEWILIVFLPAFCFMSAQALNSLFKKKLFYKTIVIFVLVLFVLVNVRAILASYDNFGLTAKADAVKLAIQKAEGRDFHLESIGSCYQMGYLYLFWYFGHFPTTSYADDMFSGTFYPRTTIKPEITIVIASPSENESEKYSEKYNFYKENAVQSQKTNGIEVLVVEDDK